LLSADEEREIREEMAHYPDPQSVCIDALKIVQRQRGWISDESVRDIAEFLSMSVDDLDGIASFYNLIFRKPVGRHVVMVCDSVSCWIMGSERICERLTEQLNVPLGGTTSDERFTLLPVVCLGACDHAPVLMVGDDLHRDLDPDALGAVLERYT
jgi:NADH-quinone oxidoreductase subunit E